MDHNIKSSSARANKIINIMDEEWDYLIILDACRYDYFYKNFKKYLRGKLIKILSTASHTLEWCEESFTEYYNDVIYISANPIINSKIEVKGFKAKNHFFKIIDVWDWGWNEKLGTVQPKKVNEAVLKFKDIYPDKKFIIHYLQPHEPYLGSIHSIGFLRPMTGTILKGLQSDGIHNFLELLIKILTFLAKKLKLLGNRPSWKIRELLNLSPSTPMDAIRRKTGDAGLRLSYEKNLKIVLENVKNLVGELSGTIIITSDHGELLGEKGNYSHGPNFIDPLLKEIPWFIVEK